MVPASDGTLSLHLQLWGNRVGLCVSWRESLCNFSCRLTLRNLVQGRGRAFRESLGCPVWILTPPFPTWLSSRRLRIERIWEEDINGPCWPGFQIALSPPFSSEKCCKRGWEIVFFDRRTGYGKIIAAGGAAAAPAGRNRCGAVRTGRPWEPLPAACATRFSDKGL